MKRFVFIIAVSLFLSAPLAHAASGKATTNVCKKIVNLRTVSSSARGGSIIWKSNWNTRAGREQTYWEGNHSQKGGAFLIYYRSGLAPTSFSIQVRDSKCNVIGSMGRYPRCTNLGCGEHERWYFRTSGGSGDSIASIATKARKKGGSNTILLPLRNGSWARVNSVYDNREQF